jgi:hypothetical protein
MMPIPTVFMDTRPHDTKHLNKRTMDTNQKQTYLYSARIIDVEHEIFIGLAPEPDKMAQVIRFQYCGKIYRLQKCIVSPNKLVFEYDSNATLVLTKYYNPFAKAIETQIPFTEEPHRKEKEEKTDIHTDMEDPPVQEFDIQITAIYPESNSPVQIPMTLFARKLFTRIGIDADDYDKIPDFVRASK